MLDLGMESIPTSTSLCLDPWMGGRSMVLSEEQRQCAALCAHG
jgi:hypothetical protein